MILRGWTFLMSEVPLYIQLSSEEGTHARPFVGVFQRQLSQGWSTFDTNLQQNGSKNGETAPRPGTGYPHKGPSVGKGTIDLRDF